MSSVDNKNNMTGEIVVNKINLNGLIIELPVEVKFIDGVLTKEAFLAALIQAVKEGKQQKRRRWWRKNK